MTRRPNLYVRFQLWWNRRMCRHHWHPADVMIAWVCCWCSWEVDGSPRDLTDDCMYEQLP